MKKILVFMVLMALALTAGAQNLSQQRRAQLKASSTKFTLVKVGKNKKNWFALMYFPVSYGFHIASTSELYKALNLHYNIQSENGPYSIATKGFYLATDYTGYQRMKALAKKYGTPGGGGGVG